MAKPANVHRWYKIYHEYKNKATSFILLYTVLTTLQVIFILSKVDDFVIWSDYVAAVFASLHFILSVVLCFHKVSSIPAYTYSSTAKKRKKRVEVSKDSFVSIAEIPFPLLIKDLKSVHVQLSILLFADMLFDSLSWIFSLSRLSVWITILATLTFTCRFLFVYYSFLSHNAVLTEHLFSSGFKQSIFEVLFKDLAKVSLWTAFLFLLLSMTEIVEQFWISTSVTEERVLDSQTDAYILFSSHNWQSFAKAYWLTMWISMAVLYWHMSNIVCTPFVSKLKPSYKLYSNDLNDSSIHGEKHLKRKQDFVEIWGKELGVRENKKWSIKDFPLLYNDASFYAICIVLVLLWFFSLLVVENIFSTHTDRSFSESFYKWVVPAISFFLSACVVLLFIVQKFFTSISTHSEWWKRTLYMTVLVFLAFYINIIPVRRYQKSDTSEWIALALSQGVNIVLWLLLIIDTYRGDLFKNTDIAHEWKLHMVAKYFINYFT